jgi:GNAT superfamily N-acetyltransferase
MKTTTSSLRAPKGFHFKTEKSPNANLRYEAARVLVYFVLPIKGKLVEREIGSLTLEPSHKDKKILHTHSYISEVFHGMGLGTQLYARAIKWALENKYQVRSSMSPSPQAQRVWNSKGLSKLFTITKKRGPYWVATPKKKSR